MFRLNCCWNECSEEDGKKELNEHWRRVRALTAGIVSNSCYEMICSDTTKDASLVSTSSEPLVPAIIEVNESTVSVVVGRQEYVIDISPGHSFESRHQDVVGKSSQKLNIVLDPHTTDEDAALNIPLVQPTFLGESGSSVSSILVFQSVRIVLKG